MPEDFKGSFRQHIAETQKRLEAQYRDEAEGEPDSADIERRAEEEAQFVEAQDWLIDRWGEDFPCPVCRNTRWLVSTIVPAYNDFLSFYVTCRYCGNAMSVVPGNTDMDAPQPPDSQLQLPEK
jgi:hypothetical protein